MATSSIVAGQGGLPSVIDRLRAGTTVTALGVRMSRTPDVARMAAGAGYDVIWIDLEHSSMPADAAAQIAATAGDLGLTAWVRVPEQDYGLIGRMLDGGATGIIAPRIETAEQARDIATASRFAPQGNRSQIATLPHNRFRRLPPGALASEINETTVVQILLETRRGIDNAEAIAAVDGVDIVGIGMNDLSADMGLTGNSRHPSLTQACAKVASAAAAHGKLAIIGGLADRAHLAEMLALGMAPLVFAGIDTDILATGMAQRLADWDAAPRHV